MADPTYEESQPLPDVPSYEESQPLPQQSGIPSYEESQPVGAEDEALHFLQPPPDAIEAVKDAKPRTLFELGRGALQRMVAPVIGRTREQLDEDAAALLKGDPDALEKYFDETGDLTSRGANAWTALLRGIDQLQGMGYGFGMLGADVVGADRLGEWLKGKFLANQAEIAANPPAVASVKDIDVGLEPGIRGAPQRARRTVSYAIEAALQNLPSMIPSLVGGGVGGVAAKKIISRGVQKKATETALKSVAAGQVAGAYSGSAAQQIGNIYGDMKASGAEGPQAMLVAVGAGLVSAVPEVIVPLRALRRASGAPVPKGPVEKFVRSTMGEAIMNKGIARLGVRGFENGLMEGGTEVLQNAIELAATVSQDPKTQDTFWDSYFSAVEETSLDAFLQGKIVGGVITLPSEAIGLARERATDKRAFDLGIQSMASRIGQPVDIQFDTPAGPVTIPVEPTAAAISRRAARGGERIDVGEDVLPQAPGAPAVTPQAQPTPRLDEEAAAAPLAPLAPEAPALEAPLAPVEPPAPEQLVVPPAPGVEAAPPLAAQEAPTAVPEAPGVQPPPAAAPAPQAPAAATPQAAPAPQQTLPEPFTVEGIALRQAVTDQFPHLDVVEIADSAADFPEDVKQGLFDQGTDPETVEGLFHRGRVYLNASKFPTADPNRVRAKVVHEAAIHLGLRRALGVEKFRGLSEQVWKSLRDSERNTIIGRNQIAPENRDIIGEEWLAYEAERVATSGKTNTVWSRITTAIRKALRDLGLNIRLSDLEIARLIDKGFFAAAQPGAQEELGDLRGSISPVQELRQFNRELKSMPHPVVDQAQLEPPDPGAQPSIAGVAGLGGGDLRLSVDPVIREADREYIRTSVSPMPIKNEAVEQILQQYGLPNQYESLGRPDQEVLDAVKQKYTEQLGWIDSVLERESKKPGLLTTEETLGIDYHLLQLRTRYELEGNAEQAATRAGDQAQAVIHQANLATLGQKIQDAAEITQKAGSEAGRAFRARQLALKMDFSLQSLVNKKREANGWRDLSDAEMRDLQQRARKFEALNTQLARENSELKNRDIEREIAAAKGELAKTNPEVLALAREWVSSYAKRAQSAKDRFQQKWKRQFPNTPLRKSVPEGVAPLPPEMMSELGIIGGSKIADNITDQAAWEAAMVAELGEAVRPYLPEARALADQHFQEQLAAGRAEIKSKIAPRKPKKGEKRAPTQAELVEIAELDLGRVLEQGRDSSEAQNTADDDLYYPVQKLVRLFVEDNPLITRDELTDQVHATITKVQQELGMEPITREQAIDAISGRGRVRRPDAREVPKTVRELKAQLRIAAHIRDVIARLPLPRTGYQPDKQSAEVRRLTKELNEMKKEFGEVVTDEAAQLATYLQSRKTYYRNRLADLRYEIANRALRLRTKGEVRTDPELEALKREYQQTRDEHKEIFANPEYDQMQRLRLAEAAAERQIAALEADIAVGRKTAAKKPSKLISNKLQALRDRIVQLRAEQDWAQRQMQPPPDLARPADIKRWFALDRSIRNIEQQIASRNVFGPGKKVAAQQPESIQRQEERLAELKEQRRQLREELGPSKPSPTEQAILNKMALFRRQIADYHNRIANRDFVRVKKDPPDLSQNPEAMRLMAERDKVRDDFYKELHKDRMARRDMARRWVDGIQAGKRAIVNLKSSFDFSAPRQGLIALLSMGSRMATSPIKTSGDVARIFGNMYSAAFSPSRARTMLAQINNRRNAPLDRVAGIQFTDFDSPSFSKWEENARSVFDEWAELPINEGNIAKRGGVMFSRAVAGSNRAFAVFLNATRATLFDTLLDENFRDRAPTETELKALGNYVNIATGRGSLSPKLASGAAEIIWAPKLLASRLQYLIGQPLWGGAPLEGSIRARKIIAKEYARALGSGMLLYFVASMFDDKKEKDLRSSDAGKIVRGNTRVDIWGGLQQMAVLLSRLSTNKTKTLSGTEVDMGAKRRYGQPDLFTVLTRFGRSKLRPDIGIALDIATRTTYLGEPVRPTQVLEDAVVPLPFTDIAEIMKDRGWAEGAILQALNIHGAGVNTYEPRGDRERATRTQ